MNSSTPAPAQMPLYLWRISLYDALDGKGAALAGGRWNSRGRAVVYLADSPASALLETLVHLSLDVADMPDTYRLLRVKIPAQSKIPTLSSADLTSTQPDLTTTRKAGDTWIAEARTALARVPSVIAPYTWNFLLNPVHSDATKAKVVSTSKHLYDPRLLHYGSEL